MTAVNLDYLAGRRSALAGMTALAIGAAGLISVMLYYSNLDRKVSDQEVLVSRLQERMKSATSPPVADKRDAEQIARETKQANTAILALSLPWKELFEALESIRNNDVAVLAIEPDAQKGLVRISAEARRFENVADYVFALQKTALFREILILNHQIEEQDPEKPVRFVLQATWEIRR